MSEPCGFDIEFALEDPLSFAAASTDDRDAWVDTLEQVVNSHHKLLQALGREAPQADPNPINHKDHKDLLEQAHVAADFRYSNAGKRAPP